MTSCPTDKVTTHIYKVDNGISLTLDVWTPPGFENGTGTSLIHFHGGFLVIGEKTTFPPILLINACKRSNWAYITPSYPLLPEAEAAHPRAPSALCILSIYGMVDLNAGRYIVPGRPLMGPPIEDARTIMQQIDEASQTRQVIDSYGFPGDPGTDARFACINVMHQEAAIPDILTRIPGPSKRIREQGPEMIPKEQRALFPASSGVSGQWPSVALIHGDADAMVGFDQSDSLAKKLESAGVRILFERVAGKDHGFNVREIPVDFDLNIYNGNDPGFYDALRRVLAFLDSAVSRV